MSLLVKHTIIEDALRYRQRAQRCAEMAQLASTENDWVAMMRLAKYWAKIADEIERKQVQVA